MSPRDVASEPAPPGAPPPHVAAAPPAHAPAPPARPRPPIWLLVAMIGIGPFTMQVIVPSLPQMAGDLRATVTEVQLTVTLYLVAVGLGQLVYGPLSDRFGRRPLLMGGLVVFALASLAAAMAGTIGDVVVARILQAFGACAGVVLARAVIRDVWPRDEAASVLGYVTMGMTIAPMVAPILGSLLDARFGWRATMWSCLVVALPLAFVLWRRLPETLQHPQPLPGVAAVWSAYRRLWAVPSFRAHAGVVTCASGAFFAFLGGAPYVVVQGMGYSPVVFAVAFASLSIAFALGNWAAGAWSVRMGSLAVLRIGVLVNLAGAAAAVPAMLLLPPTLATFFLPMAVVAVGNGMVNPAAIAGALSARPQLAGTASALVGCLQMVFGAVLTLLVGLVEHGAGIGTALAMTGASFGTWLALRGVRRTAG